MRHGLVLAAVVIAGLLSGCVRSLHPFYSDSQLTFDPGLEGRWIDQDQKDSIVVSGDAKAKEYHVAYTDEHGKHGEFIVHLASVQGHRLLDITPDQQQSDDVSDACRAYFVPIHSCMLLDSTSADSLVLRQMSYDWFKDFIRQHPDQIESAQIGQDQFLLTAPTEKLQSFMLGNVETSGAFGEPATFHRLVPATTRP